MSAKDKNNYYAISGGKYPGIYSRHSQYVKYAEGQPGYPGYSKKCRSLPEAVSRLKSGGLAGRRCRYYSGPSGKGIYFSDKALAMEGLDEQEIRAIPKTSLDEAAALWASGRTAGRNQVCAAAAGNRPCTNISRIPLKGIFQEKEAVSPASRTAYVYIDGSYSAGGRCRYGAILAYRGRAYTCQGYVMPGPLTESGSKSATSEMAACCAAADLAAVLGARHLIVYHDSEDVCSWAYIMPGAGAQPNRTEYYAFMRDMARHMDITFRKVAAHSGVAGNETSDTLAREAEAKLLHGNPYRNRTCVVERAALSDAIPAVRRPRRKRVRRSAGHFPGLHVAFDLRIEEAAQGNHNK